MKHQISFAQYRSIDLGILSVVLVFSQVLIHFASSIWFADQLYVVSPVAAITTLVMMRWGPWAAIQMVLGGVVFTALSGGMAQHYLIYGAGNLLAMLALVMFRIWNKERIRKSVYLTLAFAFCVQLLMQLGRAGVAALLGHGPDACLGFITTDVLSELFTLFVAWIVRRIEGLFEDQKHYLLRIQSEQTIEGREQF